MTNQKILRLLLQDKVNRILRIDEKRMILEYKKLGLSEKTLYYFANYSRSYVRNKTALNLYIVTKTILS